MFERVLVPLDGSRRAAALLPLLKPMFRRADSEVILLRVAPIPAATGMIHYGPAASSEDKARSEIRVEVDALVEGGIRARALVRRGAPADEILDAAVRERAGMIAMTTHGRSGLSRWALGSVTEKVARASAVPVLAVRSFSGGRSVSANLVPTRPFAPRIILATVDGSRRSLGVAPGVLEMANQFDARVVLLSVRETKGSAPVPALSGRSAEARGSARAAPRSFAAPPIQRALRHFADRNIPVELVEAGGDPAGAILGTADQHGANLIAMATHGRSGPGRWVLGSVTERVLRAAEIPILIVRSPRLRR